MIDRGGAALCDGVSFDLVSDDLRAAIFPPSPSPSLSLARSLALSPSSSSSSSYSLSRLHPPSTLFVLSPAQFPPVGQGCAFLSKRFPERVEYSPSRSLLSSSLLLSPLVVWSSLLVPSPSHPPPLFGKFISARCINVLFRCLSLIACSRWKEYDE